MNINPELQNELDAALNAQRDHIATMGQSFSQENMEIYTQLQERVRTAQSAMNSFSAQSNSTAATGNAVATVHLIRAGKASYITEVPATATLRAVLDAAGWTVTDMTFQLRQQGMSIDVTNLDAPVGEGTHEYLCNPKYAAGAQA